MRSALVVVAAFLGVAQPTRDRIVPRDADLIRGIDQVGFGDFESALLSLRAAAQRLGREAGSEKEQALAFVYLGVAHLELDQDPPAREAFADALKRDPGFRMEASQFSAQQIRVFEEVAVRIAQEAQATARPAGAARRRSKTLPIILGATAVGSGVALAATGGAAATPPAASSTQPPTSTNPSDIVLLSATPASGSQIVLQRGRMAAIRVRVVHDTAGQFRIGVVAVPNPEFAPAQCLSGNSDLFTLEAGTPIEQDFGLFHDDPRSCPPGTFTTTELSATFYREPGAQIVFNRRLAVSYTWTR